MSFVMRPEKRRNAIEFPERAPAFTTRRIPLVGPILSQITTGSIEPVAL